MEKNGNKLIQNFRGFADGGFIKSGNKLTTVASNLTIATEVETGKSFGGSDVYRKYYSGTRAADSSASVEETLEASGVASVVDVKGNLTLASGEIVNVTGSKNDGTDYQTASIGVASGAMALLVNASAVATDELVGWDIVVEYTKA